MFAPHWPSGLHLLFHVLVGRKGRPRWKAAFRPWRAEPPGSGSCHRFSEGEKSLRCPSGARSNMVAWRLWRECVLWLHHRGGRLYHSLQTHRKTIAVYFRGGKDHSPNNNLIPRQLWHHLGPAWGGRTVPVGAFRLQNLGVPGKRSRGGGGFSGDSRRSFGMEINLPFSQKKNP